MFENRFGHNVGNVLKKPIHGHSDFGKGLRQVLILTEPSKGIPLLDGKLSGDGEVVVAEKQPSGFWAIMMMHVSKLIK
jgi:hypothetical protein